MEGTMRFPLARAEGLIVEDLGEEVLVYDLESDRVHCLTPTAARVWRACDGQTVASGLAATLDLSSDTVQQAIFELDGFGLLSSASDDAGAEGVSRREFGVRAAKVAVATASVPLIVSVAAPMAAHAQTPSFCAKLPFTNGCGTCNQGGNQTDCCCCHGGNSAEPIGCAIDANECCKSGLFNNPSHCTEGSTKTLCSAV